MESSEWRLAGQMVLATAMFLVLTAALRAQNDGESALRKKLGIPVGAKQVLIFAQSSHVDPDWLLTADEYQKLLTDRTFDRALEELAKDRRYVYSVECIFYFKRYWESHPQHPAGIGIGDQPTRPVRIP